MQRRDGPRRLRDYDDDDDDVLTRDKKLLLRYWNGQSVCHSRTRSVIMYMQT